MPAWEQNGAQVRAAESVADWLMIGVRLLERVDGKRGDHRDPLGVVGALDELGELEVGLEPCQQPAQLVVVVVVREAALRVENVQRAGHHPKEEGLALVVRREERAA